MDIDNDKREWLLHWNYVTPQNSGVRAEDTKKPKPKNAFFLHDIM